MDDEEACRGLQWVENGRRGNLRGDLRLVERSTKVGTAGRHGPLERDDGAERVRYTDFSANPRVFLLTS
jgi:hypothetical protein